MGESSSIEFIPKIICQQLAARFYPIEIPLDAIKKAAAEMNYSKLLCDSVVLSKHVVDHAFPAIVDSNI